MHARPRVIYSMCNPFTLIHESMTRGEGIQWATRTVVQQNSPLTSLPISNCNILHAVWTAAICSPQGRVHTGDTARMEYCTAWTLQHAAPCKCPCFWISRWTSLDFPMTVLQECSMGLCAAKVLGEMRSGMG